MERRKGSWAQVVSSVLLSVLCPGVGQVYGGAWGLGVAVMGAGLLARLAIWVVSGVPPTPALVALAVAGFLAIVLLQLWATADAAWRTRRGGARVPPPWWRSTWAAAVLVVAIGWLGNRVEFLRWQTVSIINGANIPTLLAGDTIAAASPAPGSMPARGEMVVFRLPRDPGTDHVRRVVGLPGDTVQMKAGRLYLNGEAVPRRDAGADIGEVLPSGLPARRYVETLPGGHSYTIVQQNDNGEFNDTPVFLVPAAHVFLLGDNRVHSADSPLPNEAGYVPAVNITGRSPVIYWADDPRRALSRVQ
jgi:signal peptidase I